MCRFAIRANFDKFIPKNGLHLSSKKLSLKDFQSRTNQNFGKPKLSIWKSLELSSGSKALAQTEQVLNLKIGPTWNIQNL